MNYFKGLLGLAVLEILAILVIKIIFGIFFSENFVAGKVVNANRVRYFKAFTEGVGTNSASLNISGSLSDEIFVSRVTGGKEVKVFDAQGNLLHSFSSNITSSGQNIAAGAIRLSDQASSLEIPEFRWYDFN